LERAYGWGHYTVKMGWLCENESFNGKVSMTGYDARIVAL